MSETLYERLGGEDAITAVVGEFYDRVMADERVAGYFDDVDMQNQRAHQAQFISSVTGGPVENSGGEMETVHAEMGITASEFQAIAIHLDDALTEFDVNQIGRQAVLEEIASYQEQSSQQLTDRRRCSVSLIEIPSSDRRQSRVLPMPLAEQYPSRKPYRTVSLFDPG